MRIVRGEEIPFVAASHEDARRPGVLKRVLATHNELNSGQVMMVNWARLPRGSGFQPHYHEDMQETFVLLDGPVDMTVDGETHELRCGDAIIIEPREVHVMRNTADHDVDYLVFGISSGDGGRTVVVDQ